MRSSEGQRRHERSTPLLLLITVAALTGCDVSRDGASLNTADAAQRAVVSDDDARRAWLEGTSPLSAESAATRAPALPRVTVDTRAPAPVAGARTLRARDGRELGSALARARGGDVIALTPGATYTGNFVLARRDGGTAWITIRTEPAEGGRSSPVPGAGTRVTPDDARAFARIVTPNVTPALRTAPSAHHYRIERVEVTAAPSVRQMTAGLVVLGVNGSEQSRPTSVPHHLILDRVYVHGAPSLDLRRCVDLQSATSAIVDSHISECHARGFDSQAVYGANGPGPFTIENNYLAGAGENVMFGGSDAQSAALVPADIVFRRNHVEKPMAWKGVWTAKNLLELKVGKRVLVEGNVFENSWVDAQTGFAIVLWSVNQGGAPGEGGAPWSETSDVTVRHNVIRNVANGFQLTDRWEGARAVPMARVSIEHNVITGIGVDPRYGEGSGGRVFQISGKVADLRIAHNTAARVGGPWLYFATQPVTPLDRLAVVDNLLDEGRPAVRSDYGNGGDAWQRYAGPGSVLRGNVVGGWVGPMVPNNHYPPPGERLITLAAESRGDLRLAPGSPYRGRASDGKDPGADPAAVARTTAGVVRGASPR